MTKEITTYAIGDVHGRHDLLVDVLAWISDDVARHGRSGKVVFLGDYVDRGPASRQVIETLIAGSQDPKVSFLCLKGNHEWMFAGACRDPNTDQAMSWFIQGGQATLESYGWDGSSTDLKQLVPAEHIEWLESLPVFHEDAERIFVHAGVVPGAPMNRQSEEAMLWIREPFLTQPHGLGKIVVHGHTPRPHGPEIFPHRINLDTRAYSTGLLTCAAFDPGARKPRIWQTYPSPAQSLLP